MMRNGSSANARRDATRGEETEKGHERPQVRPRLVWAGLALALVAVIWTGIEAMVGSVTGAVVAGAFILVGCSVSVFGGVLYEAHVSDPLHKDLKELASGGVHEGISPHTRILDRGVRLRARRRTRHARDLIEERGDMPAVSWRPLGLAGLLLASVWLLVGPWLLVYPFTVAGQDAALRDQIFAVLIGVTGLWLRQIGPNRLALGVSGGCGILLVAAGLLMPGDSLRASANEVVSGLWVLLQVTVIAASRSGTSEQVEAASVEQALHHEGPETS